MAKKLSINFEQLQAAIRDYSAAIDDLNRAVSSADRAMAELRSSKWDSRASVAYFASYSEDWKKSVEDHIQALTELRDGLVFAQKEYSKIYDQIDKLIAVLNT